MSNEVNTFLKEQRTKFLSQLSSSKPDLSNWVVTIGNEAGDLDSLASAIASAYLLSTTTSNSKINYIPLIQTASTDLYLRPENLLALKTSSIEPESLLYLSDLTKETLNLSSLGVIFFLVDQNKLQDQYGGIEAKVIGILDHHADEGYYTTAEPRIIKPFIVGSCSSLVTNHFSSSPSTAPTPFPKELIDLLLSALLIDTGLKSLKDGGKAGDEDAKAATYLLTSFAPISFVGINSTNSLTSPSKGSLLDKKMKALNVAKFDVSNMSGRDLLRRDYKEYKEVKEGEGGLTLTYGLSTVPVGFKEWLLKVRSSSNSVTEVESEKIKGWKAIELDLEGWSKERGLGLLGVLTSFVSEPKFPGLKGKHQREILIYLPPTSSSSSTFSTKLKPTFKLLEEDKVLELKKWKGMKKSLGPSEQSDAWRIWSQGNAKATRKQIAPILKAIVGKVLL